MPENKPIHISVIPFIGKAKAGNMEPVKLYFNMQASDGGTIGVLSLYGFDTHNSTREFRAIEMPNANFKYELSDLLVQSGGNVFLATLKPLKSTVGETTGTRRSGRIDEVNSWPKGIYIFWLKIEMSPTPLRPEWNSGSVLFQFEIA